MNNLIVLALLMAFVMGVEYGKASADFQAKSVAILAGYPHE